MKKLAFFALTALVLVATACGHKKGEIEEEFVGMTVEDSLRMTLANQDSLLSLINDINDDLATIRQMEDIMSNPGTLTQENRSARQRMHDEMLAIQQTLQQRRERLADLEKKLQWAYAGNANLKKTVESLQNQISDLEGTIAVLNGTVAKKNVIIAQQAEQIDSLSYTITAVNEAKEAAEEENVRLTDDLNTCYFVIGTKKELNNNSIIKSGFLRKTKIMPGDVDTKFFTKADKRTLLEINCHNKKAEVMTSQPASSYEFITEANGDKILVIKNPDEFWKKSDFLVIKIG